MPDAEDVRQESPPPLDRFWTSLKVAGRSKGTLSEYGYDYKFWNARAEALGKTVYTLTISDIEACLEDMHPATVRRKVAFLRTLGKWCLRQGYPDLQAEVAKFEAPRLYERIPKDRGQAAFISLFATAKGLCSEGKREGLWLGLMLFGLRISEVATAVPRGAGCIVVLGKGGKERLVPVPGWVLEAMATIQRDGNGGWARSRKTIWHGLNKELGLRNPHSFRHTFASELLRRKKSLEQIQVLLGHKKLDTTLVYARVQVPPDVVEVLEREVTAGSSDV